VIITSATIDPERFAKHFGSERPGTDRRGLRTNVPGGDPLPASLPAAGGPSTDDERTTLDDELEEDRDPLDAVCDAVDELAQKRPATSWCSFPASAKSATPRRPAGTGSSPTGGSPAPKCCRCSRA
jgi:hypothetical protein